MNYTPNFTDPRVLKRLRHALGYARGVFSEDKEQEKSKQALARHFGQPQHPLSQYLLNLLLVCTDHHYSKVAGVSKKYRLNSQGVAHAREILRGNQEVAFTAPEIRLLALNPGDRELDAIVVNNFVTREHAEELRTLEFNYTDKSNRYWNDLQNIRSEYRKEILARNGLKWQYDIQACAPTLLMQHAQQQSGVCFIEIERFLKDRTEYRAQIAECAGIDTRQAKVVINSLFCGALLGLNNQFALSRILDYDVNRILAVKDCTSDLRADIKDMWEEIKPTMNRRRNVTGRLIPVQPRDKWNRYFHLERIVIDSVRTYLKQTDNQYFLEHDGWTCARELCLRELVEHVYETTGFSIELDVCEYVCENYATTDNTDLSDDNIHIDSTAA